MTSAPIPKGFQEASARCRGCLAYHECKSTAVKGLVDGREPPRPAMARLRASLRPVRPLASLAVGIGGALAAATLGGLVWLTAEPETRVREFAGAEVGSGVQVRVRSGDGEQPSTLLARARAAARGVLFPARSDYSAVHGTVVINEATARAIAELLRSHENPALTVDARAVAAAGLDRHRGALQHEAGHVRHHDAERQTGVFAAAAFATYTLGNLALAPRVRSVCAKTKALGNGPVGTMMFHAAHATLVLGSAWTGLLLSRRYARALEQCADDAVVTAAGIRGLASTLEEEDARARAWMRDNGVETWAEAREIYLREDPAHPPLPVRIDRLLARLPVDGKDTV